MQNGLRQALKVFDPKGVETHRLKTAVLRSCCILERPDHTLDFSSLTLDDLNALAMLTWYSSQIFLSSSHSEGKITTVQILSLRQQL